MITSVYVFNPARAFICLCKSTRNVSIKPSGMLARTTSLHSAFVILAIRFQAQKEKQQKLHSRKFVFNFVRLIASERIETERLTQQQSDENHDQRRHQQQVRFEVNRFLLLHQFIKIPFVVEAGINFIFWRHRVTQVVDFRRERWFETDARAVPEADTTRALWIQHKFPPGDDFVCFIHDVHWRRKIQMKSFKILFSDVYNFSNYFDVLTKAFCARSTAICDQLSPTLNAN